MAGYEKLAALAASEHREDPTEFNECKHCGGPTAREVCRKCSLLEAIETA